MADFLTQVLKSSSGFYILEIPEIQESKLLIGPLIGSGEASGACYGGFVTYSAWSKKQLGSAEIFEKKSLLESLKSKSSCLQNLSFSSSDFEAYSKDFEEFQSREEFEKAVLFKDYKAPGVFPSLEDFCSLLKNSQMQNNWLYAFYDPQNQCALLGSTPEYLYSYRDGIYSTLAVAGTRAPQESGAWSEKLKKEQALVMEDIKQKLQMDVNFSEAREQKKNGLRHLVSRAEIHSFAPIEDLAQRLHPTSAVGALPSSLSQDPLLHPQDRSYFGGYAEYKKDDFAFALVCIRGFEWNKNQVRVRVGGGVIAESSKEEEWQELELKWKSFKENWKI